jgi:glutamate synthase (ferredoxin)
MGKNTKPCLMTKSILQYKCLYYGALDGPTSIPFTDGNVIGARLTEMVCVPRYTLTKDGFVIMASELF